MATRLPPNIQRIASVASAVTKGASAKAAQATESIKEALQAQHRTDIFTHFTKANGISELIFSAEQWTRVRLTLENAGPVAIGTREDIAPVLSGKGILLETGVEKEFDIPRGNRLYIVAGTINRVKVIYQPIPWLEQIVRALTILKR